MMLGRDRGVSLRGSRTHHSAPEVSATIRGRPKACPDGAREHPQACLRFPQRVPRAANPLRRALTGLANTLMGFAAATVGEHPKACPDGAAGPVLQGQSPRPRGPTIPFEVCDYKPAKIDDSVPHGAQLVLPGMRYHRARLRDSRASTGPVQGPGAPHEHPKAYSNGEQTP